MPWTDPVPSVQSKLSASEVFQPHLPFSKEQVVPQSFSSVPSPQSSVKSQLCSGVKQLPFSQSMEPGGQNPGRRIVTALIMIFVVIDFLLRTICLGGCNKSILT